MTSEKTLQAMIDYASTFVEQVMAEQGQVVGMYHIVRDDGPDMIINAGDLGDTKDEAAFAIRAILKQTNATRYLYMTEAWVMDTTPAELERIGKEGVERQPGRAEAVVLIAGDH